MNANQTSGPQRFQWMQSCWASIRHLKVTGTRERVVTLLCVTILRVAINKKPSSARLQKMTVRAPCEPYSIYLFKCGIRPGT